METWAVEILCHRQDSAQTCRDSRATHIGDQRRAYSASSCARTRSLLLLTDQQGMLQPILDSLHKEPSRAKQYSSDLDWLNSTPVTRHTLYHSPTSSQS